MRYRTILCATDGRQHSQRALRRAAELARESRAELHVMHVPERDPDVAMLRSSDYPDALSAERAQAIRAQISALVDGDPPLAVVPHLLCDGSGADLRPGAVARRIDALAERIDADLIVVGTRRRGSIAGAIASSVSQRLLHLTRRPILVLAADAADAADATGGAHATGATHSSRQRTRRPAASLASA